MPGKVKVKIISGRNLPVMDRSSDTTDAYVEIKLGSTTFKTDVCRKSLHPQWNSDWYKFEADDAELQDEPLQIRLMDHDTYSANDAIGKVYIDLNPLLLPSSSLLLKWNGEPTSSNDNTSNSVLSGWVPVYDTMHGIRGEVNIIVKVELFSDFNKFRQSSCGVQFFCSPVIPHGFYSHIIHGFVEELVVNDDPEYQWIDKIRTPRASNEARQTLFFKLSGELQRRIGLKALDLGANAVIGYSQNFDLEGESGIVARGIGTAVTLVTLQDIPNPVPANPESEERAQNYLKFLSSSSGFRLNRQPASILTSNPRMTCVNPFIAPLKIANKCESPPMKRYLSQTTIRAPNQIIKEHLQHSSSLQTILKQEDMRRPRGSSFSQRIKNMKYNVFSRTLSVIKGKFSEPTLAELDVENTSIILPPKIKSKRRKFLRTISDSSIMAELLVRSTMQPDSSLDEIAEHHDANTTPLESSLSIPSDFGEYCSSNATSSSSSSEEDNSENKESNVVLDTVSDIVKDVEEKLHMQNIQHECAIENNEILFGTSKTYTSLNSTPIFQSEASVTSNDSDNIITCNKKVEFLVGDTENSPVVANKNPFNFGDIKKSHMFVLESNVKGCPVPPLVVTAHKSDEMDDESQQNTKHSVLNKLQMIASTALHNVLMENLRHKVDNHIKIDATSKADATVDNRGLLPEGLGEKRRSYVDIMDLQTNPLQYNPLPRKIDFSVFNSKFLEGATSSNTGVDISSKEDTNIKDTNSTNLHIVGSSVAATKEENIDSNIREKEDSNIAKKENLGFNFASISPVRAVNSETTSLSSASISSETQSPALRKVEPQVFIYPEKPDGQTISEKENNSTKSHLSPSLLQLALGNMVKETAHGIMATSHVDSTDIKPKEVNKDSKPATPSPKSTPPQSPSLLQMATSSNSDSKKAIKKKTKSTPPHSPTLLQLALGNVIKETAQDAMAMAHMKGNSNVQHKENSEEAKINRTESVTSKTSVKSDSKAKKDSIKSEKKHQQEIKKLEKKQLHDQKHMHDKSHTPSLFQMALGNVIRETAQDIMAMAHVEDKPNNSKESTALIQPEEETDLKCELPKSFSRPQLHISMSSTTLNTLNSPDTVSLDNVSLNTALHTVIIETVHDIMSEKNVEPDTPRMLTPNLFANLNFRALRRSIDMGSSKNDIKDIPEEDEEYEEKEIAHSRVYHALVDKFKGIVSNIHLGKETDQKVKCLKSHSLLQTALSNILTESVNDTMVLSNKQNKPDIFAETEPTMRKTSSLLELSKMSENVTAPAEKKHHNFVQNIMHNVLTDKIHSFTKSHFTFHEKQKTDSASYEKETIVPVLVTTPIPIIYNENSCLETSDASTNIEFIDVAHKNQIIDEDNTAHVTVKIDAIDSAYIPASIDNFHSVTADDSIAGSSTGNSSLISCLAPNIQPANTEFDAGVNSTHACLTKFHRNPSSPRQDTIKVEYGHQRAESVGAKMSQSPAKVYTIPNIHRRSSDSDLSITPKGNSFTGSDRSGGCIGGNFMRNNIMRSAVAQDNFSILEYPFLTMQKFPAGFVSYIGGSVSARSVKLLERISNPEQPESRDTWWSEIRMEIRSHARSLNCNAVLGYNETTSICDDVCVLSANGTAAIIGYHGENDNGPLPFMPKNQQKEIILTAEHVEKDKSKDATPAIKCGSPDDTFSSNVTPCTICHLPYSTSSLPMRTNSSKCKCCRLNKVPDVLIATIEIPENAPLVGRGCFIQSYVCRPLRDLKGESNAKEISDGLPFLEYELHRLLVNKLKIRGMNAIFGLKLRISIGERTLIGSATGTAVFLSPLPAPSLPKLVCDADDRKIAYLQKSLHDIVKKNIEIYQLKPDVDNHRIISDNEDSEDETVTDLALAHKDCCVLEIDDPEDREVLNLLMEPRPPDGFHVVNTEHVPGLDDLEIVKNLQMFTQIFRAKIQPPYNLDKHFHKLLETIYFKLRRMIPCALCDLQFRVDTPEADEIQLCVVGMALGLGDPVKNPKIKRKLMMQSKKNEDDLIFKMEEDNIPENSIPPTNFLHTQAFKLRPKSPMRIKGSSKQAHVPYRERHGVDITPLSYVPGGKIEKYLGNLNFFFIRETTSIREEGGLSGFLHSFVTEVLAIVRAHVTAIGGNAMVAYFMTECVLNHNLHKNQGQCLINVGGDVVHVSYYTED